MFPFGFGLGYAEVTIAGATAPDARSVSVTLRNPSSRDGVEVVQVYAHRIDRMSLPPDEPEQRLVGFRKVAVAAGAEQTVHIALDPEAFRSWDPDGHCWQQASGPFELRVGRSSADRAVTLEVQP